MYASLIIIDDFMKGMEDVAVIKGIVLTKQGEDIVVEAWMPDGSYREVIRERAEGPISHCVHAQGIRNAVK